MIDFALFKHPLQKLCLSWCFLPVQNERYVGP